MRPNDPLMDAWWKTERAKHHLNELREQIDAFMADDPVTVTKIEDPERRVSRYQAVFKQPHVWFFLIAGDIFQCLRTALDQSVGWLASAQHKDPDWTQFPIFATNTPRNRERFERQTRGVSKKSADVIELFQPYKREQGTPLNAHMLWQLNEINRIGKHRRISVRATAARIDGFVSSPLIPIENGCELAVKWDSPDMVYEPVFHPIIVFGDKDAGFTVRIEQMERIHQFVGQVVLPHLAGSALP